MCPSAFTLGHMCADKSLDMSSNLRPSVKALLNMYRYELLITYYILQFRFKLYGIAEILTAVEMCVLWDLDEQRKLSDDEIAWLHCFEGH